MLSIDNNGHEEIKNCKTVRNQILASIIGNLIVLAQGCTIGWVSPSLLVLNSDATPLRTGPINVTEASWIGSVIAIGAASGTILFGIISNYFGSKNGVLWCSLPIIVHWIIIKFADEVWQICIARFLTGLTGGGAFICIPLFIAEIASDHVRGSLSSLLSVKFNIGILLGLILGSTVEYTTYPLVAITFPIVFLMSFSFFPNTPQYLLYCNRIKDAKKSLKFYRNFDPNCENERYELFVEFEKLKAIAMENKLSEQWMIISALYEPNVLKGMLTGIVLMMINCFTGAFTLINYAATVFSESGSGLNPNASAIVLGALQICGTLCTIAIIDRLGRKLLMIISTAGVALSLSVMTVYSYVSHQGYDLSHYNSVPVISLSLVIFISAIGILPIPYVMIAEILPQKVRRVGATMCVTLSCIFTFMSLKIFPLLVNIIHIYGCMTIFTAFAVFGLLFSIFVLEETKGKNLDILDRCKN